MAGPNLALIKTNEALQHLPWFGTDLTWEIGGNDLNSEFVDWKSLEIVD